MEDNIYKRIAQLSNVNRFQGRALTAPYNVSSHSFRVTYLVHRIIEEKYQLGLIKVEEYLEIVLAAMYHDIEEATISDIPAPYKKYLTLNKEELFNKEYICSDTNLHNFIKDSQSKLKNHSDLAYEILDLADGLESLITCSFEIERGNVSLLRCYEELKEKLKDVVQKYPYALHLYQKAIYDVTLVHGLE